MKPKEWLFKNGHMTREEADKRGRMSAANKALVMEAVANGENIDGYSVVRGNDNATTAAPTVERVKSDPNVIADVPDVSRDERDTKAYRLDGDKRVEVGMRTVCNLCGSSLTYCWCPEPRVWVDFDTQTVVKFAPR